MYINGGRVKDVTRHPMLKPLVDIRARIYDMQHEAGSRDILSFSENGARHTIANKLPRTQQDWWDKRRRATDGAGHIHRGRRRSAHLREPGLRRAAALPCARRTACLRPSRRTTCLMMAGRS